MMPMPDCLLAADRVQITYRVLSRALKIHVNTAKELVLRISIVQAPLVLSLL